MDALLGLRSGRDPLVVATDVLEQVRASADGRFSSDAVDALAGAAEREAFWLTLLPESLPGFVGEVSRDHLVRQVDLDELEQLALMFSRVVDAKSPFTAEHSLGVGRAAALLAERSGMDPQHVRLVQVAGLFHDLGKLRVPDRILEKPAALDTTERASMARHSFYTYNILRRIAGLEEVAE